MSVTLGSPADLDDDELADLLRRRHSTCSDDCAMCEARQDAELLAAAEA